MSNDKVQSIMELVDTITDCAQKGYPFSNMRIVLESAIREAIAAPGVAQGWVMVPVDLPRRARVYLLSGESSWAALLNTVSVPCHAEQPTPPTSEPAR